MRGRVKVARVELSLFRRRAIRLALQHEPGLVRLLLGQFSALPFSTTADSGPAGSPQAQDTPGVQTRPWSRSSCVISPVCERVTCSVSCCALAVVL